MKSKGKGCVHITGEIKYTRFVDAVVTHNEDVRKEKACAVKWIPNQPVAVTYEEVLENHTIYTIEIVDRRRDRQYIY